MEDFDAFMEKLREEYHDLGLTDSQIIWAKSNGLTREKIRAILENWNKIKRDFEEVWDMLTKSMNEIFESEKFKNLVEALEQIQKHELEQSPRNKKGKNQKPWEKKKFYQ